MKTVGERARRRRGEGVEGEGKGGRGGEEEEQSVKCELGGGGDSGREGRGKLVCLRTELFDKDVCVGDSPQTRNECTN